MWFSEVSSDELSSSRLYSCPCIFIVIVITTYYIFFCAFSILGTWYLPFATVVFLFRKSVVDEEWKSRWEVYKSIRVIGCSSICCLLLLLINVGRLSISLMVKRAGISIVYWSFDCRLKRSAGEIASKRKFEPNKMNGKESKKKKLKEDWCSKREQPNFNAPKSYQSAIHMLNR